MDFDIWKNNDGHMGTPHKAHIMLRDLLTQKCVNKKRLLIMDTPEHVDSENIKLKIGSRSLNEFKSHFERVSSGDLFSI
jgi:hypothetical protein